MCARPGARAAAVAVKRGAKTTAAQSQADAAARPSCTVRSSGAASNDAVSSGSGVSACRDGQARVRRRQRERRVPRQRRHGAGRPGRDGGPPTRGGRHYCLFLVVRCSRRCGGSIAGAGASAASSRACACTESRTRSEARMVEVVPTDPRGSGGLRWSRRGAQQRSAAPGMSAARS